MPVSTEICWDLEDWAAWSLESAEEPLEEEESVSRAPPSRLMVSWILVSLVSRLRVALRTRGWVDIVTVLLLL